MNLERKILEHLKQNKDGNFVNLAFLDEDYNLIKKTVTNLQGRNLIVLENRKPRDFEAFGIVRELNSINAKINSRGEEYLYFLNKKSKSTKETQKNKFWKLAYFFG